MKKHKLLLRTLAFLLVLAIAVAGVQSLFGLGDYSIDSRERGYKQETPETLDAVYIGASHVFSFFQPPLAWDEFGISVFSYAIPSMPACTVKYRLIEARKTQPDALYIINLNCLKGLQVTTQSAHRSLDYMPWSLNKLRMMNVLMDEAGFEGLDRLEYFLPLIRFHSGWSELQTQDFVHPVNGRKGAYTYKPFLQTSEDLSDRLISSEERGELTEKQLEILDDLLAYCDEEQVRVLFVIVPQVLSKTVLSQIKTAEDIVQERGYDCLDLTNRVDEMGLLPDVDFNDKSHTNIHGSIKFTEYLSQYLVEHYGFTDKRGEPGWESWDKSVSLYNDVIGPYTLPFERTHAPRDYDLAMPSLSVAGKDAHSASFSWSASDGAEGYEVYRKADGEENGYWHCIATADGGTLEFTDSDLDAGTGYTYTVVPYRTQGDSVLYGNFYFAGIGVTTEEEE